MAKRTAIIDLGSNSVRMAIFERTSRYGFHLVKEIKSRVRVGEGAYGQNGTLQNEPLERTVSILKEFHNLCKNLNCHKIICIATSALRDAPNSKNFINQVRHEAGIGMSIIRGTKEAEYGAIGAINLLPTLKEATTIDIGGGSTELAKIINGKIVDTLSLNIGTVRLKELFFDTKKSTDDLEKFLEAVISKTPKHFHSSTVVGIGGTLRALSNAIMERMNYPLKTVHGFEYEIAKHSSWIANIANSTVLDLKEFGFKKDRLDTVREGCAIFHKLILTLKAEQVITSGAGVREGVFLNDLLRQAHGRFPANFNPSIRSLMDRFASNPKDDTYIAKCACKLFDVLAPLHKVDDSCKSQLHISGKLHSIGRSLSFYQSHLHGFYFIINNLNFGFTHKEKTLIALLVKTHHNKLPSFSDLSGYEDLLPEGNVVGWLSFLLSFAKCLNIDFSKPKIEFYYKNHTLHVKSDGSMQLAKEAVKKLVKPASFAIAFR
ncbi:MAG: Ppx/GppA family phosphatase [Campylobacteraceae bacterium]|nr:Ppx/GppA family phosphatase [Campylobacteraceae bacterium]